jgi:glycosyltransferase involved in cell wall biosynthesis
MNAGVRVATAEAAGGGRAPLVTIAVPVYNGAAFIEAAVRSACAQTCADMEILVVDNDSTDDTVARVSAIARTDPRVRLVRNPANVGMTGNFNRCLELAAGEYVKFLCADDLLDPRCTERMLDAIRDEPGVAIVSCARRLIDPSGAPLGEVRHVQAPRRLTGGEALRVIFHVKNLAGEPTAVLFRRDRAARGFDPAYGQALDVEMWFHLLASGDLLILPDLLCSIRMHPDQGTQQNLRSGRLVEDKRQLFRAYGPRACVGARPWHRMLWDLRMASSLARSGPETLRSVRAEGLAEVYFPTLFRMLWPLIALWQGWRA